MFCVLDILCARREVRRSKVAVNMSGGKQKSRQHCRIALNNECCDQMEICGTKSWRKRDRRGAGKGQERNDLGVCDNVPTMLPVVFLARQIPLSPSFLILSLLQRVCESHGAEKNTLGMRAYLGSPLLLAPCLAIRSGAFLPRPLSALLAHALLRCPELSSSRTFGARD